MALATEGQVDVGTPYINWSREITQPTPNRAGEILGKAIGKGVEETGAGLRSSAEGITAAINVGLENDVYKRGDEFMNQEVNNLYKVYAGIEQTPTPIKNLPQDVKVLTDARDNGKISNTDHDARLDRLAKELRAKYPGFRAEVDEHLRAATGRGSTANQLYESLRGDIDASVAARKEAHNKVMTELWSAAQQGVAAAPQWAQMYQAGMLDDLGVMKKIGGAFQFKYQNAQDEAAIHHIQLQNDQDKRAGDLASKNLTFRGNHMIEDEMNNYTFQFGGKDYTMSQFEQAWEDGRVKPSEEQAVQLRQLWDARKASIRQTLYGQMHAPNEKGQSLASAMGEERYNKEADDIFKTWDLFADSMLDGKYSVAKAAEIIAKAQAAKAMTDLEKDPELGPLVTRLKGLGGLPPAVSGPLVTAIMGDQTLTDAFKTKLMSSTTALASEPEPDITGTGHYKGTTLAKELDKAKNDRIPPAGIKRLLDTVSMIGNTKVPDKTALNLINSIYGVTDQGIVGKFNTAPNRDGSTDSNEVFKLITAPKNTRRVWKMGQEYPKVWENYVGFSENEWHTKTINDLTDLQQYMVKPGVKLHFDTDHNQFDLQLDQNNKDPRRLYSQADFIRAKAVVRRINDGLNNMSNIYAEDGINVSAQLVKLLYSAGMQFPSITYTKPMLDALRAAYAKEPEEDVGADRK